MKNAISIGGSGLKCDNPKCNYVNIGINPSEYKNWVNAKCPDCGEILLTKADYNASVCLMGIVELVNKIFPKREDNEEEAVMRVTSNGSGDMNATTKNK